MKRVAMIFLGWLALSASVFAGPDAAPHEDTQLQNSWKEVRQGGEITLVSNYAAPVPFSTTGEPEATLGMDAEVVAPGKKSLEEIVADEVREIRKELQIAEYDEDDGKKPVDGIATWYETIDGTRVAFIKYRAIGVAGQTPGLPRTAIHSILIRGDRVFFTHLIVLYAGHQDEVRHDQRVVIHSMITAPVGKAARRE
jgi:hypothetical protein